MANPKPVPPLNGRGRLYRNVRRYPGKSSVEMPTPVSFTANRINGLAWESVPRCLQKASILPRRV